MPAPGFSQPLAQHASQSQGAGSVRRTAGMLVKAELLPA
jgi:hypothetical protein